MDSFWPFLMDSQQAFCCAAIVVRIAVALFASSPKATSDRFQSSIETIRSIIRDSA